MTTAAERLQAVAMEFAAETASTQPDAGRVTVAAERLRTAAVEFAAEAVPSPSVPPSVPDAVPDADAGAQPQPVPTAAQRFLAAVTEFDAQTSSPHLRSEAEVRECLEAWRKATAIADGGAARAAHELHGRGVARRDGATSLSAWLRNQLRLSLPAARRLADLGAQIAARPAISAAVTAGQVSAEQASVIGNTISDLPTGLDPEIVNACEKALLQHARRWEPTTLRKLGGRILDHIAPEIAEQALRDRLDRDEARAAKTQSLTLTPLGDGRMRLSALFGAEAAAIIRATLDPLSKPIPGPDGARDPRDVGMRQADAFIDICRITLATDRLPDNGGNRPQLNVTVNFDALTKELGVGLLDTGEQISPGVARRLACGALIIPAVLGGNSEVLDLGRARRLVSGAVRRALEIRDGGCAFPCCERPAKWCDAHHILSWIDGGVTSVANGVLLCGFHHRIIHNSNWQVRLAADGRPEFIPPRYADPDQTPQRNIFHRRP